MGGSARICEKTEMDFRREVALIFKRIVGGHGIRNDIPTLVLDVIVSCSEF